VTVTIDHIRAMTVTDMPPEPDHMGLLLDMAQARLALPSRNAVWRHIGVDPRLGRAYLSRMSHRVTWPTFVTLRNLALPVEDTGLDPHTARDINAA
jgi:hypothetical protein